jgi:homogentisate 1,2-dioxygenase
MSNSNPNHPRPPPPQLEVDDTYRYLSGLGNSFSSEAVPGSLPVGQNSPLLCPLGLYAEQLSGTSFTTPRHRNLRTYPPTHLPSSSPACSSKIHEFLLTTNCRWLYRIKPSVTHEPFHPRDPPNRRLVGDFDDRTTTVATPTQLRWRPQEVPRAPPHVDFVDGLYTICGAGSSFLRHGFAVHMYYCSICLGACSLLGFTLQCSVHAGGIMFQVQTKWNDSLTAHSCCRYAANKSMDGCAFCNADGDFLIVPQQGSKFFLLHPMQFTHIS